MEKEKGGKGGREVDRVGERERVRGGKGEGERERGKKEEKTNVWMQRKYHTREKVMTVIVVI